MVRRSGIDRYVLVCVMNKNLHMTEGYAATDFAWQQQQHCFFAAAMVPDCKMPLSDDSKKRASMSSGLRLAGYGNVSGYSHRSGRH
jgi:hypothetical protein